MNSTFKSNMPGLGELSMSSPLAILKRAIVRKSYVSQPRLQSRIHFPRRLKGVAGWGGEGQ